MADCIDFHQCILNPALNNQYNHQYFLIYNIKKHILKQIIKRILIHIYYYEQKQLLDEDLPKKYLLTDIMYPLGQIIEETGLDAQLRIVKSPDDTSLKEFFKFISKYHN